MSGGQMGAPMVFRGPNGAAARVGAQHSQDYAAWYMQIPGLKVAMPYSAADAKGLMKSAIKSDNPVVFLENELLYGQSFEVPVLDDYTVPFGKARVWQKGDDVTIVSFGIGMKYALEAAAKQLTRRCAGQRSRRAVDEHRGHGGFKVGELLAHARRAGPQTAGGSRDRAFLDDGRKDLDPPKGDPPGCLGHVALLMFRRALRRGRPRAVT